MNRHLHNTLTALAASGSLLVLGLIAAAPLLPPDPGTAPVASSIDQFDAMFGTTTAEAAIATGDASAAQALAVALEQAAGQTLDSALQRKTRTSPRARRQALVMPYLSFVPRG
jgi:hypothetical protein